MMINDFLNEHKNDFDTYKNRPDWNGYKVYSVGLKSNEGACIGYPQYALEKDGKIRESTLEETMAIMRANISTIPDDEK